MSLRWQTILAIDFDQWAARTYAANFPGVRVECGPVADYIDKLPEAQILLGGPPCQPFSSAGEGEGEDDERDCIPDFIAAVRKVRPRMFLMENVKGLLTKAHWPYFCRAIDSLSEAGYVVKWKLLDAVNFGVPQFRERVWVWGIRADLYAAGMRQEWPVPSHEWPPPGPSMFGEALLPGVTVRQALGLEGFLRAERGKGMCERHGPRRDIPTDEPSPLIAAGNAGSGCRYQFIQSHADPAQTIDRPAPTLRSGGDGHDGCCLRVSYDHGVAELDLPSPTIKAGGNVDANGRQGGGCPPVIEYRWSDAMLQKHPPASPASPAPTVLAKWFRGGAEGLLRVDVADRPSDTITNGGTATGGSEPIRHFRNQFVRRLTPLECFRLQSGPDDFVWPDGIKKTNMFRVIGNGWSSRMGTVFAEAFASVDPDSRTVISLFCGGGLGDVGFHGRSWSFAAPSPAPGTEAAR